MIVPSPPIVSVYSPYHGFNVKFGRRRGVAPGPRLHLRDYLKFSLPDAPVSADYTMKASSALAQMYLNDQYGDCVIAQGYHAVGVLTANASLATPPEPFIATNQQIIADYSAIGQFDPNNPTTTDNGCVIEDALNYWTQTGFANGTKLVGTCVLCATDVREVRQALYLFENAPIGIELPTAWVDNMPSAPGWVWDVAGSPNPQNGHCIGGCGYDDKVIKIASWGMIGNLTYEALATYATQASGGEIHVMLSPDQIAKGQAKAPNGVAWNDLLADFQLVKRAA